MSKQLYSNRYVLKINSSRLKSCNWNLNLSLQNAKNNEELVALGDSQLIRFIREIKGIKYTEEEINNIKKQIKLLKKQRNTSDNKVKIKELYNKLDEILFVDGLVIIVYENKTDFDTATSKNGFTINGVKYKRLLGTTGGIKKNSIFHCSEEIYDELNKRLENNRNKNVPLIPAKYEAYKSLSASVSTPVTQPRGILVIKDGVTNIKDKVIRVSDNGQGEFKVEHDIEYETDKEFCDGCGIITAKLSEQWAIDLGLTKVDKSGKISADYIPSGFNTRYSFMKGMVFTFPLLEFAEEIAENYFVEDVWGNLIDVRNVDIVITSNMLKLWNCYTSIDDYLENCNKNGYKLSVTKVCPKQLEEKRNMNYQYLQSYEDMTDEDIDEFVKETVDNIKGALGEDYIKTILFAKGIYLNENNTKNIEYDFIKALMIDKNVVNDSYVKSKIYKMIKKRINDAKKGVITVDGNYSVISGDLFALCQSMFKMNITGLLKHGQFYSRHWLDKGIKEVVAYRSPMTSHNNIKKLNLYTNDRIDKWYRYMTTCIVFNAWDFTTDSLNGCDFDSDSLITTNNNILLKNTKEKQPIICEQKSVPKVKITESLIKKSNKNGFGEDIGTITNRVTAMYDVLASLEKNSQEYDELMNRIICGQAYQQESIDRIKGIEAKKMPKQWYDYKINKILEDDIEEEVDIKNRNIKLMVNKKPYFFIYNYEMLLNKYNKFVKDVKNNCILRFGVTIEELSNKDILKEEERKFLNSIKYKSPVFNNNCTMNRICWKIEEEFKDVKLKIRDNNDFDYSIYKSDKKYKKEIYKDVELIYKEYRKKQKQYSETIRSVINKDFKNNASEEKQVFINNFKSKCAEVCPNEEDLCNIIIDIVYKSNTNKQFAWDICNEQIIKNLSNKNNNEYVYPELDINGDIFWNGYRFSAKVIKLCEE